jgi:hypothetical protein
MISGWSSIRPRGRARRIERECRDQGEKVFLFVVTAVTILLDQFSKTAVSF